MKHWAYIGIALIVANASFLGVGRAAELRTWDPAQPSPGFHLLRIPVGYFWGKTPKELRSPVLIRLFAGQNLSALWMKDPAGFTIADQILKGSLYIAVQNNKICVFRGKRREMAAEELIFRSLKDETYELKTRHGKGKWTRGELRLSVLKGHLLVVNRLELEDYASGILESELGSLNLNPEVLKAQLVVARTYVLSMRGDRHGREGYEFCDLPHCQVYGGIPVGGDAGLAVAMAQVEGRYLSYKGRPIAAFYHHNCGGMTSAVQDVWPTGALAYLKAVREPVNSSCQLAPKSQWRLSLSRKSLLLCFRRAEWLTRGETLEGVQVVRQDASGRAQQILIKSRRPVRVTIDKFRHAVNQYYGGEPLKSALFTIESEGDFLIFNGRGWGHGVGLCQEGAMWMSRHGKTYQEILAHYFPHTTISRLK